MSSVFFENLVYATLLQHIVIEENCLKVTELYEEEKKNGATGGRIATVQQRQGQEGSYQKRAETLLLEENCSRICVLKKDCKLTLELLDTDREPAEDPVEVERWSEYVEKYVNNEESVTDELKDLLTRKPVFLSRNVRQWRQRNKEQKNKTDGEEKEEGKDEVKDTSGDTDNNNDDKDDSKELKPSDDLDIIDNTECKFNVNSFKLVYVVNSESYLYKRMALKRAQESHKKISLKLHDKFSHWVSQWKKEHVTKEMESRCEDWLMGNTDDNRPCDTSLKEIDATEKPPYYKFCKYRVRFFKEDLDQD